MTSTNFAVLSRSSILGRALRAPLRLIPAGARLPILQGRLRGKRWIVGAHTHGCWLGSYELSNQRLLESLVQSGDTVFDIGAQTGFFTLLASELVGPTGTVVAIEPLPENLFYLRRHLLLNGIENVRVIEAAAAESGGRARLKIGSNRSTGRLDAEGEVEVTAVTVDELVLEGHTPPPQVLRCDIEGAERQMLSGARATLDRYRPALLISTHGPQIRESCCRFLTGLGYSLEEAGAGSDAQSSEILARARRRD